MPRRLVAVAVLLAAVATPAGASELRPISIESLRGRVEGPASPAFTARGLELDVPGNTHLELPLQVQVLELDVEASGPMLMTWAARSPGREFKPFGPPWRHLTLPRERRTVTLDLRIAEGWIPGATTLLGFTGTGRVVIHAMRALPLERDPAAAAAAHDRALFWAPDSVGHTTINLLTKPWWSARRGIPLATAIALAAAAAALAVLVAARLRRREGAAGLAVVAAALVALAPWDALFLVRFLPMLELRPTLDPDERIRRNYAVAPEVGALAALARRTLGPHERVGVVGPPGGWFAPQTICFNLAPRPCVILRPGEREHLGISGVGRLRDDELDAVVAHRTVQPPEGFVPVASLGPTAYVARRAR